MRNGKPAFWILWSWRANFFISPFHLRTLPEFDRRIPSCSPSLLHDCHKNSIFNERKKLAEKWVSKQFEVGCLPAAKKAKLRSRKGNNWQTLSHVATFSFPINLVRCLYRFEWNKKRKTSFPAFSSPRNKRSAECFMNIYHVCRVWKMLATVGSRKRGSIYHKKSVVSALC